MRIMHRGVPAHRDPREPFNLHFAPGSRERFERGMAQDFAIICICNNYTAAAGLIRFCLQRTAIKRGGDAPEKPIAIIQIIGPFSIAQQITTSDLYFDNHHQTLGIHTHQIGAAPILERNLTKAPDVVTSKQPHDPARDIIRCGFGVRAMGGRIKYGVLSVNHAV